MERAPVKYKRIDSAIHSLGHSFMGGTNYFDDDHVMYDVRSIVRQPPHELWINFSTGEIRPPREYPDRLLKSIAHCRGKLQQHFLSHQVDPGSLKDVTLHHRLTRLGGDTVMHAQDDRGVEHRIVVRNTDLKKVRPTRRCS
jgi:hypothetical protein